MSDTPKIIWLVPDSDDYDDWRWSNEPWHLHETDTDDQKYIREDIVQEMLKEQREECAVDAVEAFQEANTMAAIPNAIMRACLNATGEENE